MTTTRPEVSSPSDVVAPLEGAAALPNTDRSTALDRSFASSIAWSGAGRWLTQIISWPATIIIARMLSPEDYGLVVLVRVYTDFISRLTEAGLGSAVTIAPEMDDNRAGQLHTVSIMLGFAAVLGACAIAFPLARAYDRPGLQWVVFALSAIFVIEALGVVPNGLLRREFRYKTLAVADWVRSLVDIVVELILAFLGFGYWTLVLGYMAGAIAWQAVVLASRPVRFRRVKLDDVRSTLRMMKHMVAQHVTNFTVSSSDVMIGARLVSSAAMGAYSFGAQLASVPNAKVTSLVANVTPSLFREVRNDLPLFRRYITLVNLALSAAVLPAFVGIVVVASDFTSVVLGPKWMAIVIPLQLLALKAALDAAFAVFPQVLWATDHGRVVTRFGFLNLAILPPLFFLLGREYGVNGLAAAWFIGAPLVAIPRAYAALRVVQMPVRSYLGSIWPAVSGSAVLVAAVLATQHAVRIADWPVPVRLALSVIAGALAYGATLWIFHRARLREALTMLRIIRR